jgi:PilZ domain
MAEKGGIRRDDRIRTDQMVEVTWKDRSGQEKFARARTLDISELGMRVEMPEALDKLIYVTLRCSALSLHGTASVRSCVRQATKYLIGLEFSGGLKWKPKS